MDMARGDGVRRHPAYDCRPTLYRMGHSRARRGDGVCRTEHVYGVHGCRVFDRGRRRSAIPARVRPQDRGTARLWGGSQGGEGTQGVGGEKLMDFWNWTVGEWVVIGVLVIALVVFCG